MEISSEIVLNQSAIEQIAEACHNINKSYCESIGDTSQVDWDKAPENIKASAVNGVVFHLMNPEALPSDSHNKWFEFKKLDGWVYGPEKDMEKKTHPCMVSYEELPVAQRTTDYLFKQTVHSVRKILGV